VNPFLLLPVFRPKRMRMIASCSRNRCVPGMLNVAVLLVRLFHRNLKGSKHCHDERTVYFRLYFINTGTSLERLFMRTVFTSSLTSNSKSSRHHGRYRRQSIPFVHSINAFSCRVYRGSIKGITLTPFATQRRETKLTIRSHFSQGAASLLGRSLRPFSVSYNPLALPASAQYFLPPSAVSRRCRKSRSFCFTSTGICEQQSLR
jgi:hypothetical protein